MGVGCFGRPLEKGTRGCRRLQGRLGGGEHGAGGQSAGGLTGIRRGENKSPPMCRTIRLAFRFSGYKHEKSWYKQLKNPTGNDRATPSGKYRLERVNPFFDQPGKVEPLSIWDPPCCRYLTRKKTLLLDCGGSFAVIPFFQGVAYPVWACWYFLLYWFRATQQALPKANPDFPA